MRRYRYGLSDPAKTTQRRGPILASAAAHMRVAQHCLLGRVHAAWRRSRLLEIGTSNGYSTIWLAWAVAPYGGRVLSIDFNPEKQALADANLRRANLRHVVDLRPGDATRVIPATGCAACAPAGRRRPA